MLKFTVKTSVYLLLHVSVHMDHFQGAHVGPCQSYTFSDFTIKMLCVSSAVWSETAPHSSAVSLHTGLDTHNSLSHSTENLLTLHCNGKSEKV
jgi:hypothetical protein